MRLLSTAPFLATALCFASLPRAARAQVMNDVFDVSGGGGIFASSLTDLRFTAGGLIDGNSYPAVFKDANGPAGTVDFAQIYVFPDHPALVEGVTLYTLADDGVEDGVRGVSNFRLLASTQGPSSPPDVVLIEGVNPSDDGSGNTYLFSPVVLWAVQARFTRSTDAGPRVVELDGIGRSVPEPHAAGAMAAALVAPLLCRRRV